MYYGQISVIKRDGNDSGIVCPISSKGVSIGRDLNCDIRVQMARVSRLHCHIFIESGKVMLKNKSKNAITINDSKVARDQLIQLRDGDSFQIIDRTFRYDGIENKENTQHNENISVKDGASTVMMEVDAKTKRRKISIEGSALPKRSLGKRKRSDSIDQNHTEKIQRTTQEYAASIKKTSLPAPSERPNEEQNGHIWNSTPYNTTETKDDLTAPLTIEESPIPPLSSINDSPFHEFHSGAFSGRISQISFIDPDTSMENSFMSHYTEPEIFENGVKDPNIAITKDDIVFKCGQIPKKQLGEAEVFNPRTPKVTRAARPSSILKKSQTVGKPKVARVSFAPQDKVLLTPMNPKAMKPPLLYTTPAKSRSPVEKTLEIPVLDRIPDEFLDENDSLPRSHLDYDSDEDDSSDMSDDCPFVIQANGVSPSLLSSIIANQSMDNDENSSDSEEDDQATDLISHPTQMQESEEIPDFNDITAQEDRRTTSKQRNSSLPAKKNDKIVVPRRHLSCGNENNDDSPDSGCLTPTFARQAPASVEKQDSAPTSLKQLDISPMATEERPVTPTQSKKQVLTSQCRSTGRIGKSKFIPFPEEPTESFGNKKTRRAQSDANGVELIPLPLPLPSPKRSNLKSVDEHVATPITKVSSAKAKLNFTPPTESLPILMDIDKFNNSKIPTSLFSTKSNTGKKRKRSRRSSTRFLTPQLTRGSSPTQSPPRKKHCFDIEPLSISFHPKSNESMKDTKEETPERLSPPSNDFAAPETETQPPTLENSKEPMNESEVALVPEHAEAQDTPPESPVQLVEETTVQGDPIVPMEEIQSAQETPQKEPLLEVNMKENEPSTPVVQVIDYSAMNHSFPNVSCVSPIVGVPVQSFSPANTPPETPKRTASTPLRFTQSVASFLCTPVRAIGAKLFPSQSTVSVEQLTTIWKSIRDYIREEANESLIKVLYDGAPCLPYSFVTKKEMYNKIQSGAYSSLAEFEKEFNQTLECIEKNFSDISHSLCLLRAYTDDLFCSMQRDSSEEDENEEGDSFDPMMDETIPDPETAHFFITENFSSLAEPVEEKEKVHENEQEEFQCPELPKEENSPPATPTLIRNLRTLVEESQNVPCPSESDEFFSARSEFENETQVHQSEEISSGSSVDAFPPVSPAICHTRKRQSSTFGVIEPVGHWNNEEVPEEHHIVADDICIESIAITEEPETKEETSEEVYEETLEQSEEKYPNEIMDMDPVEQEAALQSEVLNVSENSSMEEETLEGEAAKVSSERKKSFADLSENSSMEEASKEEEATKVPLETPEALAKVSEKQEILSEPSKKQEILAEVAQKEELVENEILPDEEESLVDVLSEREDSFANVPESPKVLAEVSEKEKEAFFEESELELEISFSGASNRSSMVSTSSNKENMVTPRSSIVSRKESIVSSQPSSPSSEVEHESPVQKKKARSVSMASARESLGTPKSRRTSENNSSLDENCDSDSDEILLELSDDILLELSDEESSSDDNNETNAPRISNTEETSSSQDSPKHEDEIELSEEEPTAKVDYNSWTCVVLRKELKSRGLETKGLKAVLVKRLIEDDDTHAVVPTEDTCENNIQDESSSESLEIELELSMDEEPSEKSESVEEDVQQVHEKPAVDYNSWTCVVLRKELKQRGLETKGLKAVLVKRLKESDTSASSKPTKTKPSKSTNKEPTKSRSRRARR